MVTDKQILERMNGMAVFAMEQMLPEDRQKCTRFALKCMARDGKLTYDTVRAILDFSMEIEKRKSDVLNHMEDQGIEVIQK